ncbi:MAG: Asp-tRNA(Asn)/Glu-tRNA(Gln) amidotransferase subunit GatC [Gemmatimonadetes bacterium]|nr:Asp-tRNA(Asn)/Glu-tRNA(Gln) amidotransferase subunit GatC [Gemmatimonadota bacterium]
MSVTRSEVEHIARLAALAVDEASLPVLTEQIGRILEYVSQLDAVQAAGTEASAATGDYPGPRQPLRPDQVRRTSLAVPLERIAPAFKDGLFLVPRLTGLGDDEAPEDAE